MTMYDVHYLTSGSLRRASMLLATDRGVGHALRGFLDSTGPGRRRIPHPKGPVTVYDHNIGKRIPYFCTYAELRDDPKTHIEKFEGAK